MWKVRSMNWGKLEVARQKRARININILEIIKLRWTGMGEFNSDDHYIYYCGQESPKRNGVAMIVNKRVWNAVLGCNFKNNRWTLLISKAKHSISQYVYVQVCVPTSNAKEAKVEWFYEDVQDLLELTPKKDVLFITRDWNEKVRSQ